MLYSRLERVEIAVKEKIDYLSWYDKIGNVIWYEKRSNKQTNIQNKQINEQTNTDRINKMNK